MAALKQLRLNLNVICDPCRIRPWSRQPSRETRLRGKGANRMSSIPTSHNRCTNPVSDNALIQTESCLNADRTPRSPIRSPGRFAAPSNGGPTGETTSPSGSVSAGPLPGGSPPHAVIQAYNNDIDLHGRRRLCNGECLLRGCNRQCVAVRRGFTLIELLVVIAIIAVLIALVVAGGAGGARGGAADSVREQSQAARAGDAQLRELERRPAAPDGPDVQQRGRGGLEVDAGAPPRGSLRTWSWGRSTTRSTTRTRRAIRRIRRPSPRS